MHNPATEIEPLSGKRFIALDLSPGTARRNVLMFFACCWLGILMNTFIPQSQPFVLSEFLKIPESEQGVVSGKLGFWSEIILILSVGFWGAICDRFGRRIVASSAYLLFAVACILYPRSETYGELLFARMWFGLAAAAYACISVTLIADYTSGNSRGKLTGYHAMFNGLGALTTVFLLLRLPARFQAQGMTPIDAGFATYNIVACVCVLVAVLAWFLLSKQRPQISGKHPGFIRQAAQGFRAGRSPRVALAYLTAFVSRGNLAIVGTFFTLWVANYGSLEMGMNRADALKKAGMIVGVAQMVTLIAAPIFGVMADRIGHLKALVITLLVSAAGYCGTYLVGNPFGGAMILCAVLIGLGEVGVVITSAVLIADEAPAQMRGAIIGFYNLCGGIGIMIANAVGGYLFDNWNPVGPFVLFGAIAFLAALWGIQMIIVGKAR